MDTIISKNSRAYNGHYQKHQQKHKLQIIDMDVVMEQDNNYEVNFESRDIGLINQTRFIN